MSIQLLRHAPERFAYAVSLAGVRGARAMGTPPIHASPHCRRPVFWGARPRTDDVIPLSFRRATAALAAAPTRPSHPPSTRCRSQRERGRTPPTCSPSCGRSATSELAHSGSHVAFLVRGRMTDDRPCARHLWVCFHAVHRECSRAPSRGAYTRAARRSGGDLDRRRTLSSSGAHRSRGKTPRDSFLWRSTASSPNRSSARRPRQRAAPHPELSLCAARSIALGVDVERNAARAAHRGRAPRPTRRETPPHPRWRVRSGDTPTQERRSLQEAPATTILITTPGEPVPHAHLRARARRSTVSRSVHRRRGARDRRA